MIFAGIDCGKKGAIAFVDEHGHAAVNPMPILPARVERGKTLGRDEYDLAAIRALLLSEAPLFATVEKSQPMPPKMPGGIANYHRGVARGFEWMLSGLAISYQLVSPRTWQAEMHRGTSGGDTKQRSIIAAKRLFPTVSLKRTEHSKKDDDGMADALLLAAYGQRNTLIRREVVE